MEARRLLHPAGAGRTVVRGRPLGIAQPPRFVAPLLLLSLGACDPGPPAPELALPPRPAGAPTGSEVADAVRHLGFDAREARIVEEVARGNVPSWIRRLEPVVLTAEVGGTRRRLTFWTTPDYLAVGSDDDAFLVPLSPAAARRVAGAAGASLPTPPMVDAIWRAASRRLPPMRLDPSRSMRTVSYFERHDRLIDGQRMLYGVPPGSFVAGHKLDLVLVGGTATGPPGFGRYGWHRPDGVPIQPVFPIMDVRPVFSHGVRLVHREVRVDGERRDLEDVLRDPALGALVRGEEIGPGG